ncbi:MAG: hypothetical protein JW780_04705 [Clostridiales bacterium]|nr:hypothetical protein [Clostridiales bacterium]
MVHGLDKFKEYFRDHESQYVFIGGTACEILMDELGVSFRATKDLDMVLIVEALDVSFGEVFWQFIEDGGYQHRQKSTGRSCFYRFSNPSAPEFPKMIELFSRLPDSIDKKCNSVLAPIHIDDGIVSLSAIILDEIYYDTLVKGRRTVAGFSIIEIEVVILFKIKACLDMWKRLTAGETVDSGTIKKHKNDVFRLLANVSPSVRFETVKEIRVDIARFISQIKAEGINLRDIGIKWSGVDELLENLRIVYGLSDKGEEPEA